jgi:DNA polymerase III gamma/tau subunit
LIRLRPLQIVQVTNWLQNQWHLSVSQATLHAHISNGRPGYALKLSQNIEFLENRQIHLKELQELLSTSQTKRFAYAEEISKDKSKLQSALQTWSTFWRDVMLKAAGSSAPITNIDLEAQIIAIADQTRLSTAQDIVKKIERNLERLDNYINPRLVIEVFLLDMPYIPNTSRTS